jgi:hypothetical protein
MKTAICVATMDLDRIKDFYWGTIAAREIQKIIVITGNYDSSWYDFMKYTEDTNEVNEKNGLSGRTHVVICESQRRMYSSVMKLKVDACDGILDDDTCVFMADDDYFYNPHSFDFATRIMETYSHVDYLSLTKGPGVVEDHERIETFLGIRFMRLTSTLGGATIVRWSKFRDHMREFFEKYGVTDNDPGAGGMWDWKYYDEFLHTKYDGRRDNVYTILKPSLAQHCNLVSHFIEGRNGPNDHMYADNFDPLIDPFKLGELMMEYEK